MQIERKNLIFCGKCETRGVRQVLGEIDTEGNIAVMRFHKGFTLISGASFSIYCGNCKEMVFHKENVAGTVTKIIEHKQINNGSFQTL